MTSKPSNAANRRTRLLAAMIAAGCAMAFSMEANAVLTLNAIGIADGFSLSTFYTDPGATYGLLGAVSAPGGTAIGSGYARGQVYKFNDVDGQSFGTALVTVAAGGTPTGIATAGERAMSGFWAGTITRSTRPRWY